MSHSAWVSCLPRRQGWSRAATTASSADAKPAFHHLINRRAWWRWPLQLKTRVHSHEGARDIGYSRLRHDVTCMHALWHCFVAATLAVGVQPLAWHQARCVDLAFGGGAGGACMSRVLLMAVPARQEHAS